MSDPSSSREPVAGRLWDPDVPLRPRAFPFFYGWVVALIATIGVCSSMPGQTIGVGVFKTRLMAALDLSSMELSVAYMIGTLGSAAFLGMGGRFFDRVGGRKALVYSALALGSVLVGLSAIDRISAVAGRVPGFDVWPWLPSFVCLLIGFGLLRFTGQGMVTLSSRAILGKWFDRRRGLVVALSGAVVSFVFSGAPIGLECLIRQFGWQGAWLALALFILIVLVPLFWVFSRDNPEECGLEMDGGLVAQARRVNPDAFIQRDYTRAEAARTFSFWAFNATLALSALTVTAYTFHVLAIAEELAVETDYLLMLFIPTAVVSVLAGFVLSWLTDLPFVRIKYLLMVMSVANAVAYGCVGFGAYPAFGWLHILSYGISGGCFMSLVSIVWPRFYGRAHLGAISGLFLSVNVIASALGPFLFNLGERLFGAYRYGFIVCCGVSVILAVGALWADNPQRRHRVDGPSETGEP